MELTREQEEFLTECEKIFADRFTDKDVEFAQLKSKPLSDPPIVRQWDNQRNQGGGDRYNQRGSHFNHRGRDHHRQWRGGYNANRERDYDSQRRNQDDRYKDRPHYDRHRYEPY